MLYNESVVISMYEYKSQRELYLSLIPALNVKLRLLKNSDYKNIDKIDIWNYLKISKWKNSINLTISEMVNDIIHADNKDIDIYLKKYKKNYNYNRGGLCELYK